jgi:hypothetical protein
MISVKSRSYFSISYLCGAARYSREAFKAETGGSNDDETTLSHRAFVISAITSSAAALEAMINEAFADASESEGSCVATLSPDARQRLATLWKMPHTSGYPILDKFDVAHLLINGCGLDRSHHRWCNAKSIVSLRNTFVHFEPSWQEHRLRGSTDPQEDVHKFEKALSGKFVENSLVGAANPFYPDRLLGHGCAAWSVVSAIEFADHFWQSIGVAPSYEAYRHFFATK